VTLEVAVAGELNLDLILYGLPASLQQEREHLASDMVLTLGSSSAIVAHNLAALGTKTGFCSLAGDDAFGRLALARLQEAGVDVSRVRQRAEIATGLTVILQLPGGRRILTYPGAMQAMSLADLDLDYLATARHFHLSSFFLHRALRPHLSDLFRRMRAAGLTTSLDTNDDPEDRWGEDLAQTLRHVDVFLPNEREACRAAGVPDLEAAVERLAAYIPLVIVKRGPHGALARRGRETVAAPAASAPVVDPVGAGDSFNAGFLHRWLQGADLRDCLAFANRVAAHSTTKPGGTEAFRGGCSL
jgi:sugar/nucleoside kinase (ribokinase family)